MSLHRILVRVEENRGDELDIVVPSWNPDAVLTIPVSLLGGLPAADYYLAYADLSAEFVDDLALSDFEEAPEPSEQLQDL